MSVAAMTMDDQRPLMNSYDKMSKQYEQNLHNTTGGGAVVGGSGSLMVNNAGLLSGPASPTPSASEEPTTSHHNTHHASYHHTSHSHHHHHHHSHHTHQQQQQQPASRPASPPITQTHHQDTVAAAAAIAAAEQRQRLLEDEIESLKVEQTRLTQQCADAQRREKILMRRLANKEQEFQDYVSQIAEYKAAQAPSAVALRSALLDPAVNLLFDKLKKELKATKAKLEETQNELAAWKFTPDSNTGKRLMAKCRLLYQENEELGKMTSNGRLAKLETELAMQKSFSEEVKKSQSELDDFLQELDEDVEGMQSTILFLQQELKTTRDRIQILEKENYQLKTGLNTNATTDADEDATMKDEQSHENECPQDKDDKLAAVNGNNNFSHNTTPQQPANVNEQNLNTLETMDEPTCLRNNINNTTTSTTTAYFNGTEETPTEITHEGNGGAIGAKLRTVASRKRNYECDAALESSSMMHTPAVNVVASPRTLPPKKSKLRVAPVRRPSVQPIDENEMLITGNNHGNATILDNAVDGMANEECSSLNENMANNESSTTVVGNESGVVVAQRIMTRRRSVRLNGGSNGGDSNH
ncbi:pre-mRNA-splicing regulator female-lethal(2)D [Lucilia cuprina]|uniref:pre-mRNA-splicing regulator female-lethal(2)D n=1 Tax=Lucilia cuprina TaxID=7375 RepID=UPI001F0574F1|nr:pre-mRNA-splicing regulator female-lethal(2)D [Lucilia cuprina]